MSSGLEGLPDRPFSAETASKHSQGHFLQTFRIADREYAASIVDDALAAQRRGRFAHRRPWRSDHLRREFVRQLESAGSRTFGGEEQLSCEPLH